MATDATDRIGRCSADLQSPEQTALALAKAESKYGAVDVLVNSAGAARRTPPEELNAQAWHDAMNAKFFTYVHMIDLVVKKMGQRGEGVIINIVGAGGKVASPIHLPGGAANAALMLITAGLAAAYGPKGVRINAVNPAPPLPSACIPGLKRQPNSAGSVSRRPCAGPPRTFPWGAWRNHSHGGLTQAHSGIRIPAVPASLLVHACWTKNSPRMSTATAPMPRRPAAPSAK